MLWYITVDSDISVGSDSSTNSCMTTHQWRGVTRDRDTEKKAHSDLNYVWTQNYTHQPLYQIAKIGRCGH